MISFQIPATNTKILCILIVYSLQILRLISAAGSVFCSWRVSYHTACQAEAPQKEPKSLNFITYSSSKNNNQILYNCYLQLSISFYLLMLRGSKALLNYGRFFVTICTNMYLQPLPLIGRKPLMPRTHACIHAILI